MYNRLLIPLLILASACSACAQSDIVREDVQGAARIMGLEFETSEIDSLQPNIQQNLQNYRRNRELNLENSTAPALYFNPLPTGYAIPQGETRVAIQESTCTRPEELNDLAFYSIPDLACLIKGRHVTSVELTEFFLQRLLKYDPALHCVINYTRDRAMRKAQEMDDELSSGKYRGMLHGIPYGIKDLFAAVGAPTTWGATPFKEQVLNYDAAVVEALDEAGAVLIAKLSMGALAWGDVWYGEKTRNPWDITQGSSGSSAGSASAVSAGLVPFAIGTETLGSIVSPSTVCGTTGLRPTYGQISRYGAMALSWSMDKIGPICRSTEDCAIVFAAIKGADQRDLSTHDSQFEYDPNRDISGLKIGYFKRAFETGYGFKQQDSATLRKLDSLGIELTAIDMPPYPDITFILSVEAAAAFDELTRSGQDELLVRQIRQAWPNVFRAARFIPAVEYIQAQRLRTQLINQMAEAFKEVDVVVHPSWGNPMLSITNMTGHPTVVVPNGFKEDGTPTSISFTANLYRESDALLLAHKFQEATSWDKVHPELD